MFLLHVDQFLSEKLPSFIFRKTRYPPPPPKQVDKGEGRGGVGDNCLKVKGV